MPRYNQEDSEIFESFVKIAQAKGLTKTKKHEKLSPDEIAALHNVKPDSIPELEYENNISEVAHPSMSVILPAHDKMNGLFENINERHNVMVHLLNKQPTGNYNNRKLAQNSLLSSLIKIANDLDNKDIESLRVLADDCIQDLQKQALFPAILAPAVPYAVGLAVVGAAAGLLYLKNHADFKSLGFEENSKRLLSELKDFASSGSFGRDEYKKEFKDQISKVFNDISYMHQIYKSTESVLNEIESFKTEAELKVAMEHNASYEKTYEAFKAAAKNLEPVLSLLEEQFKNEEYKLRQVKDKGIWSNINDFFGGALHGGKGFQIDDFDDVAESIPPYRQSIKEVLAKIAGAESAEKSAQKKQELAKSKSEAYGKDAPKEMDSKLDKDKGKMTWQDQLAEMKKRYSNNG
jgi:hypothetical protein